MLITTNVSYVQSHLVNRPHQAGLLDKYVTTVNVHRVRTYAMGVASLQSARNAIDDCHSTAM